MEAIDDGIRSEWQDANNAALSYDGREGGWQGVDVTDTFDLFHDEIDVFENEELGQDVISAYGNYTWEWVPRDFERGEDSAQPDAFFTDPPSFEKQLRNRSREAEGCPGAGASVVLALAFPRV